MDPAALMEMFTSDRPLPTLVHILTDHTRTPEEGFKVLQVYQHFVHYASLYVKDCPITPLSNTVIYHEWQDLHVWLHAQHPETNSLDVFPSPHDVLADLVWCIPEENVKMLYRIAEGYYIYIGSQTGFTLKTLQQHGGFGELLSYIHDLQPRCHAQEIGEGEEDIIQRSPKKHLVAALRKQLVTTDPKQIQHTLAMLTEITVRAAAYLHMRDFRLTDVQVESFCGAAVIYAGSIVSQPFSDIDIALRWDLSRLDVSLLARTLLYHAFHIAGEIPVRQEVAWRLHQWMVQCVHSAIKRNARRQVSNLDITDAVTEVMRSPFRWEGFLAANARPLPNFLPHGWTGNGGHLFCWHVLPIPPIVVVEQRFLQDVQREPISPPRSPHICSTPVQRADEIEPDADCAICGHALSVLQTAGPQMTMRVDCRGGHMYHHGCLSSLINGIEAYANKCPVCRQEICSLRRSRPILDEDLDDL